MTEETGFYAESARPRVKNDIATTSARVNFSSTPYNITIPFTKRSPNHVLPNLRHSARQSYYHLPNARRCTIVFKPLRSRRATTPQNQLHLQGRAPTQKTGFVPPLLTSLRQSSIATLRHPTTDDARLIPRGLDDRAPRRRCTPTPHSCKMCGAVL